MPKNINYDALSWDELMAQARADHAQQWGPNGRDSFDPYSGGVMKTGDLSGAQIYIGSTDGREGGPLDEDAAGFGLDGSGVAINFKDEDYIGADGTNKWMTRLSRGENGKVKVDRYREETGIPIGMLMVLAAPFAVSAMGLGEAAMGAIEAGEMSLAEAMATYAPEFASEAALLGEPITAAVTGGAVGVPNAAGAGLTFDAAGSVVANEVAAAGGWISAEGGAGYLAGAAADAAELAAAASAAGGTSLAVDGVNQLANEAAKLAGQNAAAPGSILNTALPTYTMAGTTLADAAGNVLTSKVGSAVASSLLNAGINAAGTKYTADKAGAAAAQQAAAAKEAAGILAPAARDAAKLQADASTAAAGTLSNAATSAAGVQAGAYTNASSALAAALQQGAAMQSDAALRSGETLATAAESGGRRLSEAELKSAELIANGYTNASAQEVAAAKRALEVNAQTLARQEANQKPYMDLGTTALTELSKELQPGGRFNRAFTMADAQNMPAYQFALDQGTQAINNASAAGGMQLSSANIESLGKFATGTAAQYQQQAFNQWLAQNNLSLSALQNAIATGQVSTAQVQTALAQAGINAQTLEQAIGASQSAGTLGAAKATATGVTGSAKALTAAEQAAATARAQAMRDSAGFLAGGVTGAGRVNYDGTVKAADATATGIRDAATATASGQIGSAGHTATGVINAANAEAGGVIGFNNATSAGTVAQGNIVGSGASNVANVLSKTGVVDKVVDKVFSMADGIF